MSRRSGTGPGTPGQGRVAGVHQGRGSLGPITRKSDKVAILPVLRKVAILALWQASQARFCSIPGFPGPILLDSRLPRQASQARSQASQAGFPGRLPGPLPGPIPGFSRPAFWPDSRFSQARLLARFQASQEALPGPLSGFPGGSPRPDSRLPGWSRSRAGDRHGSP